MAIPSFVDQVTLRVAGGNGGHGCASVRREKFKPSAGPTAATVVTAARSSCASTRA